MIKYCVVPENIHTSPSEGFLAWTTPPLRTFHFSVILSFKRLAFCETPLLEYPLTFLGVGMDIFWNYTLAFFAIYDWEPYRKAYLAMINTA